MGMRVFGVVGDDRYPVQLGLKISLHPGHQLPRMILKVDSVPEFGRDDDFEEPLIARFLLPVESLRNINTPLGTAENGCILLTFLGRPLACEVVAVLAHGRFRWPDEPGAGRRGRSRNGRSLSLVCTGNAF